MAVTPTHTNTTLLDSFTRIRPPFSTAPAIPRVSASMSAPPARPPPHPASTPASHLPPPARKICFNAFCKDRKSEPLRKKGWRLNSGEHADLCDRCTCCYEQGTFCEAFHGDAAGWRNCETCGKRVHCGCIVSAPAYMLLDVGGVQCVACARKGVVMAPKQVWPPQLVVPLQVSERPKDFPGKGRNQMAGPVLGQWRQPSNMWNVTSAQSELHQRLAFEFDRPSSIEKLLLASRSSISSHEKKTEDQSDRTSNNLNQASRDRYANGNTALNSTSAFNTYNREGKAENLHDSDYHGGENNSVLARKGVMSNHCSTSSGINHETHLNSSVNSLSPSVLKEDSVSPVIGLAAIFSSPRDTNDSERVPTDQSHRQTTPPSGRPMLPNSNDMPNPCGEPQANLSNGRPRPDPRSRAQPLSRYFPRSTDQEIHKISGDSNSVITPLFEKILSASDAGRIGRLVLPKRCAEAYFPPISHAEGLPLKVQDLEGNEWTFQFRFWPNNNSRMYVLEGVTNCIQSMQLQAGDTVTFSRMDPEGKLVMGHRKASNTSNEQDNQTPKSGNGSVTPPETSNKNSPPESVQNLPPKGSIESRNPTNTTEMGTFAKFDKSESVQKNGPSAKSSASGKKKGSTLGSKSKRLRIDQEDSIQLKLTWEAAQDLLRPPPNGEPSVVIIEGHEFEEYEEAPVLGLPTFFVSSQNGDACQWAQCEDCSKWRKLPADALLSSRWTCSDNTWDPERASCSAAPEQRVEQFADAVPLKTTPARRTKVKVENDNFEVSDGLDTLANLAILGEGEELPSSSQPPTTKHPRHRPGCTCIVCIQPPSGKGPKHKQTCTCNVCLTVKRRFKTLMLRREKRQTEETENAFKQQKLIQSTEMSGISCDSPLTVKNINYQKAVIINGISVDEDSEQRRILSSPLKNQIDLNIQPEREEEPTLVANGSSIMLRASPKVTT